MNHQKFQERLLLWMGSVLTTVAITSGTLTIKYLASIDQRLKTLSESDARKGSQIEAIDKRLTFIEHETLKAR